MNKIDKRRFFSENLMSRDKRLNSRVMPWKGEKDPYKIWLSEVILQQTRVEQGLDYYNRFVKKYPTVAKLAAADDNEVFKLWEGLGYYSRCKNLLATARYIAFEKGGAFPDSYENIHALKGVGPYTAAAISSFAYGLPHAVVDGNVNRVLARFFGVSIPVNSTEGKKYFMRLADDLLDKKSPALYNQAIMDFGAVICKPKLPLCPQCPLNTACTALRKNMVAVLPVKKESAARKTRRIFFLVVDYKGKVYVQKRTAKDIWQNLWQFIPVEFPNLVFPEDFSAAAGNILKEYDGVLKSISRIFYQQLTHRDVEAIFVGINLRSPLKSDQFIPADKQALRALAFPRVINDYLSERSV